MSISIDRLREIDYLAPEPQAIDLAFDDDPGTEFVEIRTHHAG